MKSVAAFAGGTFIALFSLSHTHLHAQSFGWAAGIGGSNNETGEAIATDASGNVYTTGVFHGSVDFDPGPGIYSYTTSISSNDIFVSKLDADGNFVWAKTVAGNSGNNTGVGYGIAIDADQSIYVTGYFTGAKDFDPGSGSFLMTAQGFNDIFILKLDADGNFIWAKSISGTYDETAFGIASAPDGSVIVTGSFEGTVDFDPGTTTYLLTAANPGTDIFVSKLDSTGTFVWANQFSSTGISNGQNVGYGIATDAAGNIFTTGAYFDTIDFNPGAGVFILPQTWSTADVFLSKLDASGNFVWARQLEGFSSVLNQGNSIAIGADGSVYATGTLTGYIDFDPGSDTFMVYAGYKDPFVVKLTNNGDFVWSANFEGTGLDDEASSIAVLNDDVYITGYFWATMDFDPDTSTSYVLTAAGSYTDIYICQLDTSGNFVSAQGIGTGAYDAGNAISVTGCAVNVTGHYVITTDFNSGAGIDTLTSAGYDDMFVLQLNPYDAGVTVLNATATVAQAGATYQWIDCANNTAIPGATAQSFTPVVNGSYAVVLMYNSCVDTSECIAITTSDVTDFSESVSLLVYPNPASGKVLVSWNANAELQQIKVVDLTGAVVMTQTVDRGYEAQINLQYLAPGAYFVVGIGLNCSGRVLVIKE
jgi:hypothetical protein